jgi:hypothetical protein
MPTKVFKVPTDLELNPGATGHWWWNHATPTFAVWSANAVAIATGSTSAGFQQDTQLEVTRLWRRFIVIEKSTSQISDTDIETEIHYEVKNLSGTKAKFNIYFSVATP